MVVSSLLVAVQVQGRLGMALDMALLKEGNSDHHLAAHYQIRTLPKEADLG